MSIYDRDYMGGNADKEADSVREDPAFRLNLNRSSF